MVGKKNKEEFKHYNNPAYEQISISNEKIKVKFLLKNTNEIQLSFNYRNKLYFMKIVLTSLNKIFTKDDIHFEGVELNPIDKSRLADRLEEFIDYNFDSGY